MFQTRNENGTLKVLSNLESAFAAAEKDKTIWKISTQGVRLVRYFKEDGTDYWINDPIEEHIRNIKRGMKNGI